MAQEKPSGSSGKLIPNVFAKVEAFFGKLSDSVDAVDASVPVEDNATPRTLRNQINQLKVQREDFAVAIQDQRAAFVVIGKRIDDLEGDITAKRGRITDLEVETTAKGNQIAVLEVQITGKGNRIADLEAALASGRERIAYLETKLRTEDAYHQKVLLWAIISTAAAAGAAAILLTKEN